MSISKQNQPMNRRTFGIKIWRISQSVIGFVSENPFIVRDGDKLIGLVMVERNKPIEHQEIRLLFKTYYLPGLDELVFVAPGGFTSKTKKIVENDFDQKLLLTSLDVKYIFDLLSKSEFELCRQ
jgi:hypothetical protein